MTFESRYLMEIKAQVVQGRGAYIVGPERTDEDCPAQTGAEVAFSGKVAFAFARVERPCEPSEGFEPSLVGALTEYFQGVTISKM